MAGAPSSAPCYLNSAHRTFTETPAMRQARREAWEYLQQWTKQPLPSMSSQSHSKDRAERGFFSKVLGLNAHCLREHTAQSFRWGIERERRREQICGPSGGRGGWDVSEDWDWRIYATMWRRQRQPTPLLLPGKSHGRRSLVGYSPWGLKESDTTERLHFHFSLSRIGEGNGNPLQCSCLENPRDGGAWWAAVYGVTQSRTQLKWLSSSSSYHVWKR